MQVKKQHLELDMEQQTVSKSGKEYVKAVHCHPVYLTHMQSTSFEMPGWLSYKWNQDYWEKYQQPQVCRWYHSNGRRQKELKSLLMEMKEEKSEKVGLKLNIQKTKIMTSSPITSWQIDGETMEKAGSKIT